MKRSKRLAAGIESIEQEIERHKAKRDKAKSDGDAELASYYDKEIEALEKAKNKKERQLEK